MPGPDSGPDAVGPDSGPDQGQSPDSETSEPTTPLEYAPADLPAEFSIGVTFASEETSSPAYARPRLELCVSAQTSGGRMLDPTGIPVQVTVAHDRQASPDTFDWIDTEPDENTGLHSFLLPDDLSANTYWIGWRVLNGDQRLGTWLTTVYRVL